MTNIIKIENPAIFFNSNKEIDLSKTTLNDLNNFSILFNVGFEFSTSCKIIKILEIPSRTEEC